MQNITFGKGTTIRACESKGVVLIYLREILEIKEAEEATDLLEDDEWD